MDRPENILLLAKTGATLNAAAAAMALRCADGGFAVRRSDSDSSFVNQARSGSVACAIVDFDEDEALASRLRREISESDFACPVLIFSSDAQDVRLWADKEFGAVDVHPPSVIASGYFEKAVLSSIRAYDLQRRARKSAANAAIQTRLLGLIAHEIRVPLETLRFAQKSLLAANLNDEYRRIALNCERTVSYLCEYVSNFIEAARFEQGVPKVCEEEFTLRALVEEVMDLLWPHANIKGIALKLKPKFDKSASVVGDRKRLRQVLVNLIGNAIRYTDCGDVTLTVYHNRRLSFIIRDSGVGMTPERVQTVFYADSDSPAAEAGGEHSSGLGVGVALSRKLLALMRGDLTVKSNPGSGTIIRCSVPCRMMKKPQNNVAKRQEIRELVT